MKINRTAAIVATVAIVLLPAGGIYLGGRYAQYREANAKYQAALAEYNEQKPLYDQFVAACRELETGMRKAQRGVSDIAAEMMVSGYRPSMDAEQGKLMQSFNSMHALYSDNCIGAEYRGPVAPVAPEF